MLFDSPDELHTLLLPSRDMSNKILSWLAHEVGGVISADLAKQSLPLGS